MRTPVKPIDPKDHLKRMSVARQAISDAERDLNGMGEAECSNLLCRAMGAIDRRIAIIKPEANKPSAWSEAT